MDKVGLIAPLREGVVVGHGSRVPFSNPAKVESWVTDIKITFPRSFSLLYSFSPPTLSLRFLAACMYMFAAGCKTRCKTRQPRISTIQIAQLAEHWALNRKVDGSNPKGCLQA